MHLNTQGSTIPPFKADTKTIPHSHQGIYVMSLIEVDMILLKRRSYIPTLLSRHHDKIERTCAAPPSTKSPQCRQATYKTPIHLNAPKTNRKNSSRAHEAASVILFAVFETTAPWECEGEM